MYNENFISRFFIKKSSALTKTLEILMKWLTRLV